MNPHKKRLHQLLELTVSEKRGMLAFLVFFILIAGLPSLYRRYFKEEIKLDELEEKVLAIRKKRNDEALPEKRSVSYKQFDPNLVSETELIDLGFSSKIAKRIIKYRKAGGIFKSSDDLERIYGLDKEHYNQLRKYVVIAVESDPREVEHPHSISKKKDEIYLDLNKADSLELTKLRGIGPVYAARIVKYRRMLGGFVSEDQLNEVYGINDSLYSQLQDHVYIDSTVEIQTISINKASKKELRMHPYFRSWPLCNAIINYRIQHGSYHSQRDLVRVQVISDSILKKVSPYISYN